MKSIFESTFVFVLLSRVFKYKFLLKLIFLNIVGATQRLRFYDVHLSRCTKKIAAYEVSRGGLF